MDKSDEAQRIADRMSLEQRISTVRANIAELTEQAAGQSGGATEELISQRIESQEALLAKLQAELGALEKRA